MTFPRRRRRAARSPGKRIDELTFDELQGFSVDGQALIPTLAEVLAALRGRLDVFVELKAAGIEGPVLDVIHDSPAPARCAVHSFDHEAIRRCRSVAPSVRGGILFDKPPGDVVAAMRHADARDVWPREDLIDAALVGAVHGAGGRVLAWTVNNPERAQAARCARRGRAVHRHARGAARRRSADDGADARGRDRRGHDGAWHRVRVGTRGVSRIAHRRGPSPSSIVA